LGADQIPATLNLEALAVDWVDLEPSASVMPPQPAGAFTMSRSFVRLCIRIGFLLLLLLAAGALKGNAGDPPKKVDSSMTFVGHQEVLYVNFDREKFGAWTEPIFAVLDTHFLSETKPRTVVVEVTLHPDRPADVLVAGRPALTDAEAKAVLKGADADKSARSRVVDGTFEFVAKINGGTPDDSGPLIPPLPSLADRRLARFQPASTAGKVALMRSWARNEAIPLLAEFALRRDRPRDEAVRKLGKALGGVKRDGLIDVDALTEKNPDYWLALMEGSESDLLVPAVRVALLVANGEIRRAELVSDAVEPFVDKSWGSSWVLGDFQWMVSRFEAEVKSRFQQGIALHREGKYDGALKVYDDLLRDYPTSASALFERFHTLRAKEHKTTLPPTTNRTIAGWPEVRKAILNANPLFPMMAAARGPDEVYEVHLRNEIGTLFKDHAKFDHDHVRYAHIALDLGQPGFAALLYWKARTNLEPEAYQNRNLIEDVLYCLEQLGVKDLKCKFPGDHAAAFQRIDAERAKRRQEYPRFPIFTVPLEEVLKPSGAR
jgi:hypothetical protein